MKRFILVAMAIGAIFGFTVLGPKVFKQYQQDVAEMRRSE